MNGWKFTRVWQVDHKLVVADTINEAVELFKAYMGKGYTEPCIVEGISVDWASSDFNALIKEEK